MNTTLHFSSAKDDWRTPPALFAALDAEFHFNTDPACTEENALCAYRIYDGLETDWSDDGDYSNVRVFLNPPYSKGLQKKFIAKAVEETKKGALVVALLPARTDTKLFHDYIWDTHKHRPRPWVQEVRFLKGRVKFVGASHGAPFPSMIVVFRG